MNKDTPNNRLSENKSLGNIEENVTAEVISKNDESIAAKGQEQNAACSTTRRGFYSRLTLRKFLKAFRSYLSSEDDLPLQCSVRQGHGLAIVDKEPMFVIVNSSGLSSPSSREMRVDNKNEDYLKTNNLFTRLLTKNVIPNHFPSTSSELLLNNSPSSEEMQMFEVNLQNDSEIGLEEDEDNTSIVQSYLRTKDLINGMEGTLVVTKKKASLLENLSIPKTIIEGRILSKFSHSGSSNSSTEDNMPSEEALDEAIPSFPGSPRVLSLSVTQPDQALLRTLKPGLKQESIEELGEFERTYQTTISLLKDQEFLIAAEAGNGELLEKLIREGVNVQQTDLFGRNALHLAVHSGNDEAIIVALMAGIKATTKDDIGMTPLSICLMRRPKARIAELLFQYGAEILPRASPMDTGIFIQFVMMCTPTSEDEKILRLLVEHGALVDDPGAPGQRQALHFAAMSDNCALIRVLADLGANPCALNHQKKTPLEVAMIYKCKDAVECLTQIERERALATKLDETGNPDKTSGPNKTANPDQNSGPNQTANPYKTLDLNETANADKTVGLNETANPDKMLGLNETANPDNTLGPNDTANRDKILGLSEATNLNPKDLNENVNSDLHEPGPLNRIRNAFHESEHKISVDDEANFRIIGIVRSKTTASDNSNSSEENSNKKN